MLFSRKCWFSWKWPPEPIKTLGNTWYFRHGRKVDFYVKKLNFKLKMWNFQRKRKILRIFSIFCEFSNYAKPAGAGKVRFLRFHQKVRISLKWLKYWEFHENGGNLVKVLLFRPCRKYQVLPSVSIGILGTFRENT